MNFLSVWFFIFIVDKTAVSERLPSWEQFCLIASSSHSFGLPDNTFLQSKVVSLASNRQPRGPGLCIQLPQWFVDPVAPHSPVLLRPLLGFPELQWSYSNCVPFWDSQSFSGAILNLLQTCPFYFHLPNLFWPPQWSYGLEFLATDTEVPGSISGATRFSEKKWVWNVIHSSFMRITEELLEWKSNGFGLENRD
jgi:hypothetical protein